MGEGMGSKELKGSEEPRHEHVFIDGKKFEVGVKLCSGEVGKERGVERNGKGDEVISKDIGWRGGRGRQELLVEAAELSEERSCACKLSRGEEAPKGIEGSG